MIKHALWRVSVRIWGRRGRGGEGEERRRSEVTVEVLVCEFPKCEDRARGPHPFQTLPDFKTRLQSPGLRVPGQEALEGPGGSAVGPARSKGVVAGEAGTRGHSGSTDKQSSPELGVGSRRVCRFHGDTVVGGSHAEHGAGRGAVALPGDPSPSRPGAPSDSRSEWDGSPGGVASPPIFKRWVGAPEM